MKQRPLQATENPRFAAAMKIAEGMKFRTNKSNGARLWRFAMREALK